MPLATTHRLRLLWVATKSPWPAIDGGRLLMAETLSALATLGHEITLVVPGANPPAALPKGITWAGVEAPCPAWPRQLVGCLTQPLTLVRHQRPAIRRRVLDLLSRNRFDAMHFEQLQALASFDGLLTHPASLLSRIPRIVRAQNVENAIWRAASEVASPGSRWLWQFEAGRLRRSESRLLSQADRVLALTSEDREAFLKLGLENVYAVPAPFPSRLPAGDEVLPGDPSLVLLAGRGWLPNRDGARWFLSELWPTLLDHHPAARLHLFGDPAQRGGPGVVVHPTLDDSRQAFAPKSTLVVPLRVASGVRMKILEAWARGIPVIATRAAAQGLRGEGLLQLADTPEELLTAILTLETPAERQTRSFRAQELLVKRHDPALIAAQLADLYAGSPLGSECLPGPKGVHRRS